MRNIKTILEQKELIYCETNFYNNPVIGKEIVRFNWYSPKYRGHFKTVKGIKHFDDFIMEELRYLSDKNQMLNPCCKPVI